MDEDELDQLKEKLAQLKEEHRDLDDAIDRLSKQTPIDFMQMQRLKKRKLGLRDLIQRMESSMLPDIIA